MEGSDSTAEEAGKVRCAQNQSEYRFDAHCDSPHSLMAQSELESYMLSLWYNFHGICEKILHFFFFNLIQNKASYFNGKMETALSTEI